MKHTLMPWERGVVFRRGALLEVLGPGRHRLRWRDVVHRVDVRPRSYAPAWQDVPTADGVLVRVTVVLNWEVVDAAAFVVAAASPFDELHLAAQLALRAAVLTRSHDRVDAERGAIAAEVLSGMRPRAAELGVEVRAVAVRDVVMPAELRKAALNEIVARSEGRAALERARGETAALRSLLNVARLAEEHPALLELRALQSAHTVVVDRPR
ncbi:SPFH domain-containing protein [Saccharothrix coeruleofusca]|uniref:Membrane protein n=1 Tax=Saccharothrix coeruleofusca TaxID=33919 RepID=A0A918EB94_9PSEU|nr:SPFH domain-containing protein [Saccharothrix coeruleofusca]GGP40205.1 membrane protein [Saccharothrix coeruleofusca]